MVRSSVVCARSVQELLVSYGFAEEWLGRRAGPKAEWDRAVGTAVLGRAAAETSAAISEHTSLIGFVPHPGGISRYLDDRSNIRGTRTITKVRLGHLMVMATVGRMLHWPLPGPGACCAATGLRPCKIS